MLLVGERAAQIPGLFSALVDAASRSGARLAWVPRRAGDRGAVEAGCLPNLLPGGRPASDRTAAVDLGAAWGVDRLPTEPGLDGDAMLAAAASGALQALVVAGLQPTDLADSDAARDAFEKVGFLVSLEQRVSDVTSRADVVLPVALVEEQAGTFLDWEHRAGRVNRVNREAASPMTDLRVLAALADALGSDLGVRTPKAALAELTELGAWDGARAVAPTWGQVPDEGDGLLLASWRQLIDGSAGNAGADALLATAKPALARVSPATAQALGLGDGETLTIHGPAGNRSMPVLVEPTMVDGTVWVPGNDGFAGLGELRVAAGDRVRVSVGGAA